MNGNNIFYIDFIRAVAIFMVVLVHSSAPAVYGYNQLPLETWVTANIYNSAARVGVPLFFMISGALLLSKDEPIILFLTKRFYKLFVPLVFWAIFFVFYKDFVLGKSNVTFRSFSSLLLAPSYYHLWFLYAIIGNYLYIPVLRKVALNCDNQILFYFICIWIFAVSIIPFGQTIIGVKSSIDLLSISGYVGYFVLGFILSKVECSKRHAVLAFYLYFFCVCFTAYSTYFFTIRNGGILYENFYEYLAPNIIVASASFFIFSKYIADIFFVKKSKIFFILLSLK